MTHVYLIRHGQADGLQPGIIGSTIPDAGLSSLGVKQAGRLRDRLAATGEIRADAFVSSPLRRAQETAEIIAPALGLPVLLDEDMEEVKLGEAEGLSKEAVQERFGPFNLRKEPFRRAAPDGESWAEFVLRIYRGLDRLTQHYRGQTLVIVCHGGVIGAAFNMFLGLNLLQRTFYADAENTSITHWHQEPLEGQEGRWWLRRANDFTHLLDLEASQLIPWEALARKLEQTSAFSPVVPHSSSLGASSS